MPNNCYSTRSTSNTRAKGIYILQKVFYKTVSPYRQLGDIQEVQVNRRVRVNSAIPSCLKSSLTFLKQFASSSPYPLPPLLKQGVEGLEFCKGKAL